MARGPVARSTGIRRLPTTARAVRGTSTSSVLGLQAAIGNRAVVRDLQRDAAPDQPVVQRDPVITAYDRNTEKNKQSDATLNLAQLRQALTAGVTNGPDRTTVLQKLAADPDVQVADVAALARHLTGGLHENTRRQVEEVVGNLLQGPHLEQWTQGEADQNDLLLRAPNANLSRAKGTPNTIPLATLDNITGGNFTALMAAVRALDAKSRKPLSFNECAHLDETFWLNHLSGEMDVRSCHTNGAGWLPVATTTARYTQLDTQIKDSSRFQATKRSQPLSAFRFTTINKLPADDRRDFLWTAHCGQFEGSPYVEFSVAGKKDLRLVYQCLTGVFYATVHYKWQRGYNPFFRIT